MFSYDLSQFSNSIRKAQLILSTGLDSGLWLLASCCPEEICGISPLQQNINYSANKLVQNYFQLLDIK